MVALVGLTTALTGLTTSAGSLSGIFSSLGSLLSSVGAAIKAAFGAAIDFLKEKFQMIKDWFMENIYPLFEPTSRWR